MANKIKHMERSHRSYNENKSIFSMFAFNANLKKSKKENALKFENVQSGPIDGLKNLLRRKQAR